MLSEMFWCPSSSNPALDRLSLPTKGDCALAKLSKGGLTIGIALYDALLTDLAVIGEEARGRPEICVPFVVAVCIDVEAVGDPTMLGEGKGR